MKLSLVATQGKAQGKAIPITLSQFFIGRDPVCHLRPASPMISKRHCALMVRGGQVFVRDFNSTNGTFVNEDPVKGEHQLNDNDHLKVGPLVFLVRIEDLARVPPLPVSKPAAPAEEESVAALLLDSAGDPVPPEKAAEVGEIIPGGSTVFDIPASALPPEIREATEAAVNPPAPPSLPADPQDPAAKKPPNAKPHADTSAAAKSILDKYTRRPRS